jgi:hypothetical protein
MSKEIELAEKEYLNQTGLSRSELDMSDGSSFALTDIDYAMEKHLVSRGFTWEWRSVLGNDCDGNPIWSLTIYVSKENE